MNFASPSTMTIVGVTNVGKSYFMRQLIKQNVFETPPKKIYWFYGIWQDNFEEMENVEFFKGLPDTFDHYFSGEPILIVIDDLQDVVTKSNEVENLFCRGMHHANATVCYLTQNLFYQGKNARNIALNSHYIILFKNPRGITQVQTLAKQTGMRHLVSAYEDAMKEKYGYLVLDLCPHSRDEFRLRSHVLPGEDPIIYS